MGLKSDIRKEAAIFTAAMGKAEREFQPIFLKALNDSMRPLFEYVDEFGVDNVPVSKLLTVDPWIAAYTEAYQTIGLRFAEAEYKNQEAKETKYSKAFGFPKFLVDVWSGIMRDYALRYTYDIPRTLNDTTEDIITRALGTDYGFEIDRQGIVRLFKKRMGESNTVRSFTISRTETTTIANLGKEVAAREWMKEADLKSYKIWIGLIVGERAEHLETNDTILPIDQPYVMYSVKDGSTHECERPGDINLPPELRINCRCTQSIVSENVRDQYEKRGLIQDGKIIG